MSDGMYGVVAFLLLLATGAAVGAGIGFVAARAVVRAMGWLVS